MKILVTGGAGYVGSRLVPALLADGHEVVVYDIGWFGLSHLPIAAPRSPITVVQADIRDTARLATALQGCEAVIHLACVSNDHSCQLDEALSTEINLHAFEPLVLAARAAGVRRFIYASTSSVYGVSDAPDVTEDHPLVPLTLYNRYKGECEPILWRHQAEGFTCVTLRPATVCGPAPRMRFDLTANILTAHAALKREMTVFGGAQRRPNLHIADMVRCYQTLLAAPAELIAGETFNVGAENMSVAAIAVLVQEVVQDELHRRAAIRTEASTDNRSYHVKSDKIARVLGFRPAFGVRDAVRQLCKGFRDGLWPDALENPLYTNVRQLVEKGHAVRDSLAAYRKDRYAL